ncbi:hypothetical protein HDU76_009533, partial [Blyttiomyces sp. JEL0837]
LTIYNLATSTPQFPPLQFPSPTSTIEITTGSSYFYVGLESGQVWVIDALRGVKSDYVIPCLASTSSFDEHQEHVVESKVVILSVCPTDINLVLVGYENGVIVVWEVKARLVVKRFWYQGEREDKEKKGFLGGGKGKGSANGNGEGDIEKDLHVGPLTAACWRHDGSQIVASYGHLLVFWNVNKDNNGGGGFFDGIKAVASGNGGDKEKGKQKPLCVRTVYHGGHPFDSIECLPIYQLLWTTGFHNPLDMNDSTLFVAGGTRAGELRGVTMIEFSGVRDYKSSRHQNVLAQEVDVLQFSLVASPGAPGAGVDGNGKAVDPWALVSVTSNGDVRAHVIGLTGLSALSLTPSLTLQATADMVAVSVVTLSRFLMEDFRTVYQNLNNKATAAAPHVPLHGGRSGLAISNIAGMAVNPNPNSNVPLPTNDVVITAHADSTVRFWANATSFHALPSPPILLCTLRLSHLITLGKVSGHLPTPTNIWVDAKEGVMAISSGPVVLVLKYVSLEESSRGEEYVSLEESSRGEEVAVLKDFTDDEVERLMEQIDETIDDVLKEIRSSKEDVNLVGGGGEGVVGGDGGEQIMGDVGNDGQQPPPPPLPPRQMSNEAVGVVGAPPTETIPQVQQQASDAPPLPPRSSAGPPLPARPSTLNVNVNVKPSAAASPTSPVLSPTSVIRKMDEATGAASGVKTVEDVNPVSNPTVVVDRLFMKDVGEPRLGWCPWIQGIHMDVVTVSVFCPWLSLLASATHDGSLTVVDSVTGRAVLTDHFGGLPDGSANEVVLIHFVETFFDKASTICPVLIIATLDGSYFMYGISIFNNHSSPTGSPSLSQQRHEKTFTIIYPREIHFRRVLLMKGIKPLTDPKEPDTFIYNRPIHVGLLSDTGNTITRQPLKEVPIEENFLVLVGTRCVQVVLLEPGMVPRIVVEKSFSAGGGSTSGMAFGGVSLPFDFESLLKGGRTSSDGFGAGFGGRMTQTPLSPESIMSPSSDDFSSMGMGMGSLSWYSTVAAGVSVLKAQDNTFFPAVVSVSRAGVVSAMRLPTLEKVDAYGSSVVGGEFSWGLEGRRVRVLEDGRVAGWTADKEVKVFLGANGDRGRFPSVDAKIYDLGRQHTWLKTYGKAVKDAEVDELFGGRRAGHAPEIPSNAASSSTSITRPTGSSSTMGSTSAGGNAIAEAKNKLNERGEKLSNLEQKFGQLENQSSDFLKTIQETNEKQAKKKWWEL